MGAGFDLRQRFSRAEARIIPTSLRGPKGPLFQSHLALKLRFSASEARARVPAPHRAAPHTSALDWVVSLFASGQGYP